MSDVDWSQAPEWANYWTIDSIEFAEWHSHKPRMDIHPGSITSPNNWNLSWLNSAKYCYRAPAPRFGWPKFNDRRAKKRLITRPKETGMSEFDRTPKLLDEAKEKIAQQSDLIDDLFEAMNDIHKECFNEFAEDEDVIERIRIIAYRAIQNAKEEQDE